MIIGSPLAGERILLVDIIRTRASTWASTGQRDMNGHLVAVKVGVKSRANQRMQLMAFPSIEHRFKGLNPQSVQSRRPVEHNRVFAHHFIQGIPDLWGFLFHHLLGAFNGGHIPFFFQLVINKRLEQLQAPSSSADHTDADGDRAQRR